MGTLRLRVAKIYLQGWDIGGASWYHNDANTAQVRYFPAPPGESDQNLNPGRIDTTRIHPKQ